MTKRGTWVPLQERKNGDLTFAKEKVKISPGPVGRPAKKKSS